MADVIASTGRTAPDVHVVLTHDPLDVGAQYAAAVRPWAGAVSVFVGTTRDHFAGRPVVRLEYECYESMALKVLRDIAHEAHQVARAQTETKDGAQQDGSLACIRIVHRLGVVPVGEASVCITVSSAHRAPAMAACTRLIDDLKARVPIWKKEVYGTTASDSSTGTAVDGAMPAQEGAWKENPEALRPKTGQQV